MNISTQPVNSRQYTYKAPAFGAKVVDRLCVNLKTDTVSFLNNGTAVLDEPVPFFKGIKNLLNAVTKNIKNNVEGKTCLDSLDKYRLNEMLEYFPKKLFENRMLNGVVGSGNNNLAFKIDNNEVLCVSENMNFFNKRPFEDFDLPLISKGMYDTYFTKNTQGWFIRKLGEPVTDSELETIKQEIFKKGYKIKDWNPEQGCKLDNKLYLIDFECAYK